ncbi:MAG: hypothetical protein ACI9F9_001159 [Candidatus Paceibacteria bacterium]|jgi:hypothetical protein
MTSVFGQKAARNNLGNHQTELNGSKLLYSLPEQGLLGSPILNRDPQVPF